MSFLNVSTNESNFFGQVNKMFMYPLLSSEGKSEAKIGKTIKATLTKVTKIKFKLCFERT